MTDANKNATHFSHSRNCVTSDKTGYMRVVRKVRGQSYLRKNYCVLCRVTFVLLNDNQLKISMQKNIWF